MLLLIVLVMPGQASRKGGDVHTWKVTWTNIATTATGTPSFQPLTPPILVTHKNKLVIWAPGEIANAGVSMLAEDPNAAPLKAMLTGNEDVYQAVAPGAAVGPTLSGSSKSWTIQSSDGFDRLDILMMLANTNDTFTGLAGLKLEDGTTVETYAYDAGTERNNENCNFIPGPACGSHSNGIPASVVRDESGQLIHLQTPGGIQGVAGGSLNPATTGWVGAVARIKIEEVS
jgi:hypothetical protein